MSSLLTTASIWTNDNNDDSKPKKRVPTMRNAILKSPSASTAAPAPAPVQDHFVRTDEISAVPVSIAEAQASAEKRQSRINQLLENMAVDNDGQHLADFEPLDHPIIQKRTDVDEALAIPPANLRPVSDTPFHPSSSAGGYPNYQQIYNPENAVAATSRMYGQRAAPSSSGRGAVLDDRWMEKINYMIYLLEQQQNEKTNHITEEFVLYTFLGVFIIFVVDAFSRGGKYVR